MFARKDVENQASLAVGVGMQQVTLRAVNALLIAHGGESRESRVKSKELKFARRQARQNLLSTLYSLLSAASQS